jgi:hypothetical protein
MKLEVPLKFEENTGSYELVGTIYNSEKIKLADSRKPLFIFNPHFISIPEKLPRLAVHDPSGEMTDYLTDRQIIYHEFSGGFQDVQVIIINHGGLDDIFSRFSGELTQFVDRGGILIIQEPAYGVIDETEISLLDNMSIFVNYRPDPDRGGYDSYIFPENDNHFVWEDIDSEYLKMFNGGFGGEIVSQHNVKPIVPFSTVASCNLSLKVPALLEIPYGNGWVIISRVQFRGRLLINGQDDDLYKRRYDPVAEKYFLNLLAGYVNASEYQRKIKINLEKQQIYIARAKASSGQIYDALDNKMETRWSSDATDPQWVWLDLGKMTNLNKITMHWEAAFGKEYKILMSTDNTNWIEIEHVKSSDGAVDEINLDNVATRYIKIEFIQRGTQWGYSIWELRLE